MWHNFVLQMLVKRRGRLEARYIRHLETACRVPDSIIDAYFLASLTWILNCRLKDRKVTFGK